MVQRKRSSPEPQLQHGKKSTASRHDKRSRLSRANPDRRKTQAASAPLVGGIAIAALAMQSLLHARNGFRLSIVLAGALLARGRRTASSWFRAAGVQDDWDRFYELLQSVGKAAKSLCFGQAGSVKRVRSNSLAAGLKSRLKTVFIRLGTSPQTPEIYRILVKSKQL